tara:strand:+ start:339 stop:1250 length:912 start_codon:yes stop_codon:yes gene_type:complete
MHLAVMDVHFYGETNDPETGASQDPYGLLEGSTVRKPLPEVLDAVVKLGINSMFFSFGFFEDRHKYVRWPDQIDTDGMRKEFDARNIKIEALDGMYNMIHPDTEVRAQGLRRLRTMASFCDGLGVSIVHLWAGSLNSDSMWGFHADNHSPEAFNELVVSTRQAVQVAEEYGVTLAIEGGVALTPIHSAQVYRRLLDEVGSPLLKIKLDVGNLFHEGELPRHREILDEAFELLRDDIVIVDAKDNDRDGWCGGLLPGQGLLDYDHILSLVDKLGWDVPLMMDGHAQELAELEKSIAFVRERMPQ